MKVSVLRIIKHVDKPEKRKLEMVLDFGCFAYINHFQLGYFLKQNCVKLKVFKKRKSGQIIYNLIPKQTYLNQNRPL